MMQRRFTLSIILSGLACSLAAEAISNSNTAAPDAKTVADAKSEADAKGKTATATTPEAEPECRTSILDQVVVTGTLTPKTLKDVPVVTRVITSDDIQKADATNIQDMLVQELPGLEFGFAMSQETSLNLCGFGGNAVLFLVDGERLAGETMDNTDYTRLNLDNVGRIEIVKGAASALYGSNAVGGVINLITRESSAPWTLNVNSRYNSFGDEWRNGATLTTHRDKWSTQTNFQQTKIDPITLTTNASSLDDVIAALLGQTSTSTKKDDSDITRLYGQETYNIKERVTYRPNDHLRLTARGGYFYRESQRSTYDYHYHAYSGGLKGAYNWLDGRTLELSYAFDQYDKANYTPDGKRTHDHDYTNRQHVGHLLYNQTIGEKHQLTAGADVLNDYLTTYQFKDNCAHQQTNADAFAQFDWNPTSSINVVTSVRYDYFSASEAQATTARLAAMYKWTDFSLRASYAGGFRAPSLKEMYMHFDMGNMGYMIYGNPDLKPERSNNFNLAAEHTNNVNMGNWLDGSYSVTVMGYCNVFDKRITTVGRWWYTDPTTGETVLTTDEAEAKTYNPDGTEGALYYNEDGVTVTGIDVCAQYHLDMGLGLKYSYAYMHESGNTVDSQFTQPRSHSMTWRADYDRQFTEDYGINLALSGRWAGKPQSGRTDVDQGYTLCKATLQQRIWRGVRVNLAVDNIFNYKPDTYYFSSPMVIGTTWSLGVSLDIDRMFE
ncbi:MAG: TonB-dependent receptor [Bacteroidales bacterium]|nr:TonB-dependent receptor [Bacteroidales bacterium]